MKTLASPCSRVVLEIYRDRDAGLVNRVEEASCFFRPHNKNGDLRFLNLVAFLQHRKPIRPLVCLSSKTQAELETPDAQIQETYPPTKLMHVKFQMQKECYFGQQFLIVGDDPMLGLWDPECAIPMDWSDGNVWSVELELPVEKSVQFKFILKGEAGSILWQPGPDRIFHTWETENAITVFEDWGDAELQKITEEAQDYNQMEDSSFNSDMLIPEADSLTFPKEEPVFNLNMESAVVDGYTDPAQVSLGESYQEQIVLDNLSVSEEKPKTVAAENITPNWPKQMMKPHKEQKVARRNAPSEDSAAIPKKMMVAQNIYGNRGRAATARNPASSNTEGSLMNYEEGPVLVPGLTRAPAPTEEANKERVDKPMTFDGLVGDYEVTDLNMPELEEKQEPYSESPPADTVDTSNDNIKKFDEELKQKPQPAESENQSKPELPNGSPRAETTDMFNNSEVSFDDELEQKPQTAETTEQSASEQIHDVWHNDMQWGRNLLQKFLINLLPW